MSGPTSLFDLLLSNPRPLHFPLSAFRLHGLEPSTYPSKSYLPYLPSLNRFVFSDPVIESRLAPLSSYFMLYNNSS